MLTMDQQRVSRRLGRPPVEEVAEGERRQHIVRAARDLFGQHGYAAVSLSDIAERVGVTKAALYHHFRTKDELYAEMMVDILDSVTGAVRAVVEGPGSTESRLRELVARAVVHIPREIDRDSMMRDVDDRLPPVQRRAVHEAHDRYLETLHDLVRQGIECGELRSEFDSRLLVHMLVGILDHFTGLAGAKTGLPAARRTAEAISDVFLLGVRARPEGPEV